MAVIVFDRGHTFDPTFGSTSATNILRLLSDEDNYVVVYNETDGWIVQLTTPSQGVTYIGFFPETSFQPEEGKEPPFFGHVDQIEFADASAVTFVILTELGDLNIPPLIAIAFSGNLVEGDDLFFGSPDRDVLAAGEGADQLDGLEGDDTLSGQEGDDIIFGFSGDDRLFGGEENDILFGEAGADTLNGGDGDDVIVAGPGDDAVFGGVGVDLLSYADAESGVTVSMAGNSGVAQDTGGGGVDTLETLFEQLEGSNFADTLSGGAFGETLFGGLGDDTLSGANGDDVIVGGADADTLDGGGGVDLLSYFDAVAGVVVDLSIVGSAQDTVGAGLDTLSSPFEQLEGSIFNDVLMGGGADETFFGFDGDDTIQGGDGADIILGELDNDVLDGGAGADQLDGGEGHDIFVQSSDPFIDVLSGGAGFDLIDFASAAQGVVVQLSGYATSAGAQIASFGGVEDARGSAFDDALIGSGDDNFLFGGTGADWMVGGGGNDLFAPGLGGGVDRLFGGTNGADAGVDAIDYSESLTGVTVQLNGWATTSAGALLATFSGIEDVFGTGANDALIGSNADNFLFGGQGADWLVGGGGNDTFRQSIDTGAIDRLFGGAPGADSGVDTIDYSSASAAVIVQLSGYAASGGATLATFSGIENAVGGDFDDALVGSAANNRITGGAGADWLVGAGGDDMFVQDVDTASIDRLFGGTPGADAGIDTIDYSAASIGVEIRMSGSVIALAGNSTPTIATFSGIENAIGSTFNDVLVGGVGANVLAGGGGDDVFFQSVDTTGIDRLFGGTQGADAGIDTIDYTGASAGVVVQLSGYATTNAGAPAATLATFSGIESAVGTAFNDALIGAASDNRLTGGAGGDWLVGGAGADAFVYRAISDGAGDSIRDFSQIEADRIDLSAIDADPASGGDQAFIFSTVRHAGLQGEAVAANFGGSSLVSLYLDGDDVADMTLQIVHQSGVVMNASDFVL